MEEDYLEQLVMSCSKTEPRIRKNLYIEMSHGVNVSNLAVAVAREAGEDDAFCRDIEIAGILHDIGKLWINQYLEEAGRENALTVEKFKYVRMHPSYSKKVLLREGYDSRICDAVLYHHENVDGTGYPNNLHSEEIPQMAKILRISDVFCALTSDRSYRRAFDEKSAMEIMIDEAEDYDMRCFLAFQRVLHREGFRTVEDLCTKLTDLQREHLRLFVKEVESV